MNVRWAPGAALLCLLLPGVTAAVAAPLPAAGQLAGPGVWGSAGPVRGLVILNRGGNAQVTAVSCSSSGNCGAGGTFRGRRGLQQAFVAAELGGAWRAAVVVPGTAPLDASGPAGVSSVSCTGPGTCEVAGQLTEAGGRGQAFVAAGRRGRWARATVVAGTAELNRGGNAAAMAVSCTSAGNCTVVGQYADRSGHPRAFAAAERHGRWHPATQIPGTGRLGPGGAIPAQVSCTSAGNCAAAGQYVDGSGSDQVFVAFERHGVWGTAEQAPGTGILNQGGYADIASLSCASAGTAPPAASTATPLASTRHSSSPHRPVPGPSRSP